MENWLEKIKRHGEVNQEGISMITLEMMAAMIRMMPAQVAEATSHYDVSSFCTWSRVA